MRPTEIYVVDYYDEGDGRHFVNSVWYDKNKAEERLAHLSGRACKERTEDQDNWYAYGDVCKWRIEDAADVSGHM